MDDCSLLLLARSMLTSAMTEDRACKRETEREREGGGGERRGWGVR